MNGESLLARSGEIGIDNVKDWQKLQAIMLQYGLWEISRSPNGKNILIGVPDGEEEFWIERMKQAGFDASYNRRYYA